MAIEKKKYELQNGYKRVMFVLTEDHLSMIDKLKKAYRFTSRSEVMRGLITEECLHRANKQYLKG